MKNKFKFCFEYLIAGFIVENLLILFMGIYGLLNFNWCVLILTPLAIWVFEIIERNTSRTK